jgi:hypothetical protein
MAQSISSSGKLPKLAKQYGLPLEMICDLSKLCLFDNVVLADDSGSMDSVNAKTKVKRTDELKE